MYICMYACVYITCLTYGVKFGDGSVNMLIACECFPLCCANVGIVEFDSVHNVGCLL
jgi:hypothetical protein